MNALWFGLSRAGVVAAGLFAGLGSPLAAEHLWANAERSLLAGPAPGLILMALKDGLRLVLTGVGVLVGVPLVMAGLAVLVVYLMERLPRASRR